MAVSASVPEGLLGWRKRSRLSCGSHACSAADGHSGYNFVGCAAGLVLCRGAGALVPLADVQGPKPMLVGGAR